MKSGKIRHTETDSHLAPITASSRKKIEKEKYRKDKMDLFSFPFSVKKALLYVGKYRVSSSVVWESACVCVSIPAPPIQTLLTLHPLHAS